MLRLAVVLAGCVMCLFVTAASGQRNEVPAVTAPIGDKPRGASLRGISSWGYQLQNVDPSVVAASPLDLVVIDYSRNGTDAGRFTRDEVRAMQRKPDGGRRIVLAYISLGEAEDYRFYWQSSWVEPAPLRRSSVSEPAAAAGSPAAGQPVETVRIPRLVAPGWLGRENERWHGNYHVRYWYEGWQNVMIYHDNSYLARIVDAGFDGAYLDRIDAYYAMEDDRRDAASRMIDLVTDFASTARKRKANFIVLAQNAEELLREARYLAVIDGIAKEDLLFGSAGDGRGNDPDKIAKTVELLSRARAAGLAALVVEYLDNVEQIATAAAVTGTLGFLPYFGPRKLDRLALQPPAPPVSPRQ